MAKGGIIQFRDQQNADTTADDENVIVFAPAWLEKVLPKLSLEFNGVQFQIGLPSGRHWTIKNSISLIDLIAIARIEKANTSGIIKFEQYKGINKETIIALRDLVKHCGIVGKDLATHYGGYPANVAIHELNQEVYICDLSALQFQATYNTGRHVLISEKDIFPKGSLDNEIFEHTVGEKKLSFQEAKEDKTGRFLKGIFGNEPVLFDTKAYQAFVVQDFILSAIALNSQAKLATPRDELNFKFLKYGTGFFSAGLSGEAKDKLSENLTMGVLKGIQQLVNLPAEQRSQIKRIELPFYSDSHNKKITAILKKISTLCDRNGIEFATTIEDALAPTSQRYKTATTNCSDPHAPTGNEMNYGSVDASIAENLKRKGNNFNPICNSKMGYQYVKFNHLTPQVTSVKPDITKPKVNLPKRNQAIYNTQWSAIIAIFASIFVKLGAALRFQLALSWALTFSIASITFVGLEAIRFFRNLIKTSQLKQYQQKTNSDIDKLNQTQLVAFDIGQESAQSFRNQMWGLCSWEAYKAPKAFYAGYEAQLAQDDELIDRVQSRLINS